MCRVSIPPSLRYVDRRRDGRHRMAVVDSRADVKIGYGSAWRLATPSGNRGRRGTDDGYEP
jgi:hypothetical protein